MKKALFLDRDGVLIEDAHLISSMDQVKIIHGAADLIARFRNYGYLIFIVTNQTVVSRGILSLNETINLNEKIILELGKINSQVVIDKTYLCPHHPNAQIKEYKVNCECRKPKSGMLIQAQKEFNIDLSQSIMIGDRLSDIYAANAVGVYSCLLDSEKATEKLIETSIEVKQEFLKPKRVIKNLSELLPS